MFRVPIRFRAEVLLSHIGHTQLSCRTSVRHAPSLGWFSTVVTFGTLKIGQTGGVIPVAQAMIPFPSIVVLWVTSGVHLKKAQRDQQVHQDRITY